MEIEFDVVGAVFNAAEDHGLLVDDDRECVEAVWRVASILVDEPALISTLESAISKRVRDAQLAAFRAGWQSRGRL